MKTLEYYIQRELLKPFLVVLVILAGLFASFSAARFLAEAVSESLGVRAMLELVLLKTLIALEVLVPASLYIGVVVGLGRLYRDQEIVVLRAAGISPARVVYAVLMLALPIGLASGILSVSVRPWAYTESYLLDTQAQAELNTDRFQAGRFYGNEDSGSVVYIQNRSRQNREMEDIFYYEDGGGGSQVVVANRADRRLPPGKKPELHLFDGFLYELSEAGTEESVARFENMVYSPSVADEVEYKRKAAPTRSLRASTALSDVAELQWRYSRPFATVLLVLIAIPLSRVSPRQGKGEKSLLAALIFAVYYNLSGVARSWVEQGTVAPMPGIWWLYTLMFLMALVLLVPRLGRGPRIFQ